MRVKNPHQRVGDLGEVVVNFQMNARGKQRERLHQALDVRIFAAIRLELQARGDLRILFRELRAHLPDERQLSFVIIEQLFPHPILISPDTGRWSTPALCRTKSLPARDPCAAVLQCGTSACGWFRAPFPEPLAGAQSAARMSIAWFPGIPPAVFGHCSSSPKSSSDRADH